MMYANQKCSLLDSLVETGDGLGGLLVPDPSRSAEDDLARTPPELPTAFNLLHRGESSRENLMTIATRRNSIADSLA